MKLIIDIPERDYDLACKYPNALIATYAHYIKDGTPYEERPQGEWIVGEYQDCHSDILPEYTCPFCGEVAYSKYDFCHCGADMREAENE